MNRSRPKRAITKPRLNWPTTAIRLKSALVKMRLQLNFRLLLSCLTRQSAFACQLHRMQIWSVVGWLTALGNHVVQCHLPKPTPCTPHANVFMTYSKKHAPHGPHITCKDAAAKADPDFAKLEAFQSLLLFAAVTALLPCRLHPCKRALARPHFPPSTTRIAGPSQEDSHRQMARMLMGADRVLESAIGS